MGKFDHGNGSDLRIGEPTTSDSSSRSFCERCCPMGGIALYFSFKCLLVLILSLAVFISSDNPKKATPTEIAWIDLFAKSIPSFKKRAEDDDTVSNSKEKAEKFAQRYSDILEDLKKDPESHGGPPDCILLCRLREQILRELGFRDIFKKVKDDENAKAISLFSHVVNLHDAIEDPEKRSENLIRRIFAGNLFDLGSAKVIREQGLILAVLLGLSAFFSMAETSITTLWPWKVRELSDKEPDNGVFRMLRSDVTRFLTTILIGTTVVTIAATTLVMEAATAIFGDAGISAATGVMTA